MTTSIWQRPSSLRVDVAVVGGGIIGTSTAWALRQLAPDLRVALVDAEHLAHGASGRNAGFLLLGTSSDYASAVDTCGRGRARRIWAFTHEAYALAQEVAECHDIGFRPTGSLIAAGSAGEADRLRQSHALLAEDGIDSVLHDPDETTSRFGVHGFLTSLFVPTGGVVDPARLVRALASESDAHVIERTRIAHVEPDGDSVRLSASSGSSVVADRVLLALNAGLPRLLPELAPAVRPVRAQMLATAPLPPRLPAPVYSHEGYFYVRQRADGRVLVGGARHLHREAEVGYEDATTDMVQTDLERYLERHVGLCDVEIERRWSGTMGFSPDELPALGDVPGVPGAFWAAGFTGHGMGYGLRFGLLAARHVLGVGDAALDLFEAGRLTSV